MRCLLVIICSVFLCAGSANAEVCLTSGSFRIPLPYPKIWNTCHGSLEPGFEEALVHFFSEDDFGLFSSVYWPKYRLAVTEAGQPMLQHQIMVKVGLAGDVAKIQKGQVKFLARMTEFETKFEPILCIRGSTMAFVNAGGVVEYRLWVIGEKQPPRLFNDPAAIIHLDKESCEGALERVTDAQRKRLRFSLKPSSLERRMKIDIDKLDYLINEEKTDAQNNSD